LIFNFANGTTCYKIIGRPQTCFSFAFKTTEALKVEAFKVFNISGILLQYDSLRSFLSFYSFWNVILPQYGSLPFFLSPCLFRNVTIETQLILNMD
jgi:hypothetical protein